MRSFSSSFFNENHIKRGVNWSPEYSGAAAVVCALQEGGVFFCQGGNEKSKTFYFTIFGIFLSVFCGFLGRK